MTENEPIKTVSDGITFLSTGRYYDGINRWVAHKLKDGDNDAIDYALEIFLEDQAIIDRMSGRRVCKSCGATFHVVNIPPKKEGICDECEGELITRDDDVPETVKKRLNVYHEQTAPLIDYYKEQGILRVIDGSKGLDTCFKEICDILEG